MSDQPESMVISKVAHISYGRVQPREEVFISTATQECFEFLDNLQKQNNRALGFMYRKQLEAYIERGQVLIAVRGGQPVGYIIGCDRYLKRDDVGIIYQLCVAEGVQRKLIGAALVQAMFDRAAYGCRLFCCWCAQDLPANEFWESLGFVPLAFRTGSGKRRRIHIFWQKRIRPGDREMKWWFPSTTNGGAIRADRIVLPIPPGVGWRDEMPVVLPGLEDERRRLLESRSPAGSGSKRRRKRKKQAKPTSAPKGGLWFAGNGQEEQAKQEPNPNQPTAETRKQVKADARFVAAARELRDRYLEEVNSPGGGELLAETRAKYSISRLDEECPDGVCLPPGELKLLEAA